MPTTTVEFKSTEGKLYSVYHVPEHSKPFLNLCGHHNDRVNFIQVARDVLKITKGLPDNWAARGFDGAILKEVLNYLLNIEDTLSNFFLEKALDITDRRKDLIALIEIPQGYTQLGLYNFVQGYRGCFKDIKMDKGLAELVLNYDAHYAPPTITK